MAKSVLFFLMVALLYPLSAQTDIRAKCLDKKERYWSCRIHFEEKNIIVRYTTGKELTIKGDKISKITEEQPFADDADKEIPFVSTIIGETHLYVPIKMRSNKKSFFGIEYIAGYLDEDRPIKNAILIRVKEKDVPAFKFRMNTFQK